MKKYTLTFISLLIILLAFSQEQLAPVDYNPVLIKHQKQQAQRNPVTEACGLKSVDIDNTVIPATCGAGNGIISVSIVDGVGNIDYMLNGVNVMSAVANTFDYNGLAAGGYVVEVTDDVNTRASTMVTLSDPGAIPVNTGLWTIDTANCKCCNGSITRPASTDVINFFDLDLNLVATFNTGNNSVTLPAGQYFMESSLACKAVALIDIPSDDKMCLPFFDDFSTSTINPDDELWIGKSVYINSHFPLNPPTIGVATFDGLGENGQAHNTSPFAYGYADTLFSKMIDLSSLTVADSLYLSFYIQSKGLGNEPELADSFSVQMKDTAGSWRYAWSTRSGSNNSFDRIWIKIDKAEFFHDEFQFRFSNFATTSGMNDHWHIDYVLMDTSISPLTTANKDVAFYQQSDNLLEIYAEMPYRHFSGFQSDEKAGNLRSYINNNESTTRPINYKYELYTSEGCAQIQTNQTAGLSINLGAGQSDVTSMLNNLSLSPNRDDSVYLYYSSFINTSDDISVYNQQQNDYLTFTQKFESHFAYDDGSAEQAYGIFGSGNSFAVKFHTNVADTLRAIGVNFARMNDNVGSKLFSLVVWNSIDTANTGSGDNIIYRQDFINPEYLIEHNGFYQYLIDDTVLSIPAGTYYFGIIKTDKERLWFGFDANNDNSSNTYINITGAWQQSSLAGSVMIRPVVGKASLSIVGIEDKIAGNNNLLLYPNPAKNYLAINGLALGEFDYQILDLTGKSVASGISASNKIELNNLTKGLYILQVQQNGMLYNQKFIKED